jgi:hypothetical protein
MGFICLSSYPVPHPFFFTGNVKRDSYTTSKKRTPDFHAPVLYAVNGSSAIYLARLMAFLTFRWQPAQLPLRFREYILPRLVKSFCRVSISL